MGVSYHGDGWRWRVTSPTPAWSSIRTRAPRDPSRTQVSTSRRTGSASSEAMSGLYPLLSPPSSLPPTYFRPNPPHQRATPRLLPTLPPSPPSSSPPYIKTNSHPRPLFLPPLKIPWNYPVGGHKMAPEWKETGR